MEKSTQKGIEILGSALFLGVMADLLIPPVSWGVGAMIWVGVVLATAWCLLHRWDNTKADQTNGTMLPLIGMALCYVWRDASWLKLIVTCSLMAGFALSIYEAQGYGRRRAEATPGLLRTGIRALLKTPLMLYRSINWQGFAAGSNLELYRSVIRGVLIGFPIVTIFALLLGSADAGFEKLLSSVFSFDLSNLPARIFFIGFFGWLAVAFLYGVMLPIQDGNGDKEPGSHERSGLGMMEVGIVLGLVNTLFGAFLLLQLGYLFGGSSFVTEVSGLTLASYARKGFFELVVVTAMAIAVLLTLNRHFKPEGNNQQRAFKSLAGIQIGMLLLLLVSAAQRMWLYTQSYGLTELRLYTSAFMVWIACVLIWFIWTVLRGEAYRFASGAVQAGFGVVLGLFVVNPDALIARTNIARAMNGERLDTHYLNSLSADAVPVLIESLPGLNAADQQVVARALLNRRQTLLARDWRSWSGARRKALYEMTSGKGDLERALPLPLRPHISQRSMQP